MFIYEKNGAICVTFQDNKPVPAPEYVIVIDETTKDVVINGKSYTSLTTKVEEPAAPAPKKKAAPAPVVEEPQKEETQPEEIQTEEIPAE